MSTAPSVLCYNFRLITVSFPPAAFPYPPGHLNIHLTVYSYSTGLFSSRNTTRSYIFFLSFDIRHVWLCKVCASFLSNSMSRDYTLQPHKSSLSVLWYGNNEKSSSVCASDCALSTLLGAHRVVFVCFGVLVIILRLFLPFFTWSIFMLKYSCSDCLLCFTRENGGI